MNGETESREWSALDARGWTPVDGDRTRSTGWYEGEGLQIDERDIELARSLVGEQLQQAEDQFTAAWEAHSDLEASTEALTRRYGWRTVLASVEQYWSDRVASEDTAESADRDVLKVEVDGRALVEAYETVFADPGVETFVYLTGLDLGDGRVTINRVVPTPLQEQTAVSAVGDLDGQFEVLGELDEAGYQLLGHLHNHPGEGVGATEPSETDLHYQESLEALGYQAVGFIVTDDGFVQAYSSNLDFEVAVHGNSITTHDTEQHVFRRRDI